MLQGWRQGVDHHPREVAAMTPAPCFVGIDVAQAELVVCVQPSGETWSVLNAEPALSQLADRLTTLQPTLVVLEATGKLELPAATALAAAQLPVAVVNPRQVRDYARATG